MEKEQSNLLEKWAETYEKISLNSPNGALIIDDKFKIVQFNKKAETITGLTKDGIIGNNIINLFPGIQNHLKEENEFRYAFTDKILHVKKLQIEEKDTDKSRMILLLQDPQEIVNISETMGGNDNHIAKWMQMVFEGSFDGLLVTDGKGNVLFVNKAYERITGIKKEEMLGRNMIELLNAVWMRDSVVFPVIKKKSPVSMNHITRTNQNIIVTGNPICDSEGDVSMVVVNVRDVSEIYKLKDRLMDPGEMDNQKETKSKDEDELVIVSDKMKQIYSLAKKISIYDTNVLILGESGVGKEEIAKYIHKNSARNKESFVIINCAAIPENLLESEFFGYEKGAFTGAVNGKEGMFESANRGTLFLDEIGEMSPTMQAKLLRFLETREITRVGGTKSIGVDVRLLTATNRELWKMVQEGTFREDLYYRLNVVQISIPPLRERIEDIEPLSLIFTNRLNQKYRQHKKLTYHVIKELERKEWPGNVRELRNVIEQMVVVSNNEFLQIEDLPWKKQNRDAETESQNIDIKDIIPLNVAVEEVERQILSRAIREYKSTRKIAEALKVDQSTVVRKLNKYGI